MDWSALSLAGMRQTGTEWRGPCPVTGEGRNTFWINVERQALGCYRCGLEGGVHGELFQEHAERGRHLDGAAGQTGGLELGAAVDVEDRVSRASSWIQVAGRCSGACGVGAACSRVGRGRRRLGDTGGRSTSGRGSAKSPPGAGARAVDTDYSGSTDWHNAARWRWSLAPEATGARLPPEGNKRVGESVDALALRLAKASYGPGDARIFLVASTSRIGWRGCSTDYAARAAMPVGVAPEGGDSGETAASDGQGGLGFDPLAT